MICKACQGCGMMDPDARSYDAPHCQPCRGTGEQACECCSAHAATREVGPERVACCDACAEAP